jgi:hypothetical protein
MTDILQHGGHFEFPAGEHFEVKQTNGTNGIILENKKCSKLRKNEPT